MTDAEIEAVARGLATARGVQPDAISNGAQLLAIPVTFWELLVPEAKAAIAALDRVRGSAADRPECVPAYNEQALADCHMTS